MLFLCVCGGGGGLNLFFVVVVLCVLDFVLFSFSSGLAVVGTKAKFPSDLSYSMFDLQASLPSIYLLSRDRHTPTSEIPLPEDIKRNS